MLKARGQGGRWGKEEEGCLEIWRRLGALWGIDLMGVGMVGRGKNVYGTYKSGQEVNVLSGVFVNLQ